MRISISASKVQMGKAAAIDGAAHLRDALRRDGKANIIVATGASQFEMLSELVKSPNIDWSKVTAFHLDEYVGMPISHGASFRKYLWERFASQLPLPLAAFHYINAEKNPQKECDRLSALIRGRKIAVAFIGIGENGHVAFNDPPADFATDEPYIVVKLDEACRKQQLGEGWFRAMKDVPTKAISMSVKQIMKAKHIVCTVPDQRKAVAIAASLEGPVTNAVPASILQKHSSCTIFLDEPAASLLKKK
jgi:glucosamine-6-phosphate deaminase